MEDTTPSDTQASLILEAMARAPGSGWKPGMPTEPDQGLDDSLGSSFKDTSTESSGPRSVPLRYHYHGLAPSQTQSQYDDIPSNEDSQKENTPAPFEGRSHTPVHQYALASSSGSKCGSNILPGGDSYRPLESSAEISSRMSENTRADLDNSSLGLQMTNETPRSPFKAKTPVPTRSIKAVSFMSPTSKIVSSAPSLAQRRGLFTPKKPDPSSPASQDSFIGSLPDPGKAYIASSRQFDIPLSELGADDNSDASWSQSPARILRETDHRSSPERMLPAGTRRVPSPRTSLPSSSPAHVETVLVAATPSTSGSSQGLVSQDSLYNDTHDVGWFSNGQPDRSNSPPYPYDIPLGSADRDSSQQTDSEPWEATQLLGYASRSSRDVDPSPPSTVEATQATTDYQATQILSDNGGTQEEPSRRTPPVEEFLPPSRPVAYSNPPSSSNAAAPNSLLSLVPAHKRERYAAIIPESRRDRVPDVPVPPRWTNAENQSSRLGSTRTIHGDFESAHSDRRRRNTASDESTEVVPDSEPARLARLESSPSIPLADLQKRSSVGGKKPVSRKEDHDAEIPEDGEKETPAVALKKEKGKEPMRAIGRSAGKNVIPPAILQSKNKSVALNANEEIVPSSVPSQDNKSTGNNANTSSTANPDAAASSKTRQKGAGISCAKADTESDTENSEAPPRALPRSKRITRQEEEEATEPDDVAPNMDVDEQEKDVPYPAVTRTASRKRKRSVTVSKGKTRATSRTPTVKSYTPSVASTMERSGKRARTMTPSSRRHREATRVFALWRQDGHYYPGVIHASTSEAGRYTVNFDDGTKEVVEIAKMRRCELVEGDNVFIGNGQKARVIEVQGNAINSPIRVEVDQRGEVEEVDVTIGDVTIAGRTIQTHWKDRVLVPNSIVTMLQSKTRATPSAKTASVDVLNKMVYKTAFVISRSATNPQSEQEAADAVSIIKTAGGIVVDDWTSVISMNGQFSSSGNCWVAHQADVKWCGEDGIDKIFLLSDDCTTKPKFLMALALGIPCLDMHWIQSSEEHDWPAYLLPAGYSESIHARISQMVDLDWGNSVDYVHDIMNNLVASKVFANKSILCLDEKFVPIQERSRKKQTSDSRGALSSIPRIILAMGAIRVEAVTQTRFATERKLSAYDYIVVRGLSDIEPLRKDEVNVAHWDWVKDCLIAGRLLDLPA